MVTFQRLPYSVALSRGRVQDAMLTELCQSIERIEDIDWQKAESMIHRQLTPLEQF